MTEPKQTDRRWIFLCIGLAAGTVVGGLLGNAVIGAGLGLCIGSAAAGILFAFQMRG